MLKVIGLLVASLVVSVFSNESNEVINKERRNHCPYGSSEIQSNESIIGLSCINLNCANESPFCVGSIICDSSLSTFCRSFEGLLCQTEGTTSSYFRVCRAIPLETSAVKDSSEVMENSSEERIPSILELGVEGRDLSIKLNEDRINVLGDKRLLATNYNIVLGNCVDFAVMSGSDILFSLALTILKFGSVGNSPGTGISGNYRLLNGTTQRNTPAAQQCATTINTAIAKAKSAPCTATLPSAYLSGTYTPGKYCSGTLATNPNAVVALDAGNDTTAQWIFKADSTLITGAHSQFILKNGAQADNVYWAIGSSTTLGDASLFVGQMLVEASVTVGHNVLIGGRLLARAAVTFQSGALVDRSYTPIPVNVTLGNSQKFAVLAKTSITFGSGKSVIDSGSVGVSPGTSITGTYELKSGTTELNTNLAIAGIYDLETAYNTASTATCQFLLSNSELSGLVLTPGVYCSSSGKFSIAKLAFFTLDAMNRTDSVWVFQTTTTLVTGDDSSMILKNGALPKNVFWAVGSTANVGNSAFFAGSLIAQSSVVFAPYAILNGRGLSFADIQIKGYASGGLPNGTATEVKPTVKINIGACTDFALLAFNSILFSSALTVITEFSVGKTSISGNYQLTDGTTQINTAAANQCNSDFADAYDTASGKTCSAANTFAAADLSGKTIFSGVYCSTPGTFTTAAFSTLTLDAQNNPNAIWIFQTRTTLITGARSRILLTNGAQYNKVFWAVGTAATLGSSSFFIGTVFALTAVDFGTKSVMVGRAFAKTSMTFDSGSLVSQTALSTSVVMTIGSCKVFAVLAKNSISFGLGKSVFTSGSVGVSPATSITGNFEVRNGTIESNSASAQTCAYDLGTAYNSASTATCEYYLSSSELSGLTLTPGVYCTSTGKFSIDKLGLLNLDALNDVNAQWIFQTTTTLDTADFSSMILLNGALSKNVYWAVGTKVTIGYAAFFVGNLMAQSSITLSSYTLSDGRMLTFTDITFKGYSYLGVPNGPSVVIFPKVQVYLGGCLPFAVMAGSTAGFNLALTVVHSGSIGNSPGTGISGNFRLISGTSQPSTPAANLCASDHVTASGVARNSGLCPGASDPLCSAGPSPCRLDSGDMGGQTLFAGIYCFGTLSIATLRTLTLDAQNNPDALWVFQATTTLTTGLRSIIVLINGAQPVNVIWAIGSSATIGVSSVFVGNVLADAAISLSARSVIQGRVLARSTITADSGSWIDREYTFVSGSVNILSCAHFIAFAGSTITFESNGVTTVRGSIGTSPGNTITGNYVMANGGQVYMNTGPAPACQIDFTGAYNDASVATCQYNLAGAALDGLKLRPGVYCSAPGTFSLAAGGVLQLDGRNNTYAQWIFQTSTTVITGAGSIMNFINGGLSSNVYWAVGTSMTSGTNAKFIGNILAQTSITLGSMSALNGRAFALNTVTYSGNVTTELPPISPTGQPSSAPSMQPSRQPSTQPTSAPTIDGSPYPSGQPSMQPSSQPTSLPSNPSSQPSSQPSKQPSSRPSAQPSQQPTTQPSRQPSSQPSTQPSSKPSTQPSSQPSSQPSMQPSMQPSSQPSRKPSSQPSMQPSSQPSMQPSSQPSTQPSSQPSRQPSSHPTMQPSMQPSTQPSSKPTSQPSIQPSSQPSMKPSSQPSRQPSSQPSRQPSSQPSRQPSSQPSTQPSSKPSSQPSMQPSSQPSTQPSMQPSSQPSTQPSSQPSSQPSTQPSSQPSSQPSMQPSSQPSRQPTSKPSSQPSRQPSSQPSRQPSSQPSKQPSSQPTTQPSRQPSSRPSKQPSSQPSSNPTLFPTGQPTTPPSMQPSSQPSSRPSMQPSSQPSMKPSSQPSSRPSMQPTSQPSRQPSSQPSTRPSMQPTSQPSTKPSSQPSARPTMRPSSQPSRKPSSQPSQQPSSHPSGQPTTKPSMQPTSQPSMKPSAQPSRQPSSQPSSQPTMQPSTQPSTMPSNLPIARPTSQPSQQPTSKPSTQPSTQPSMKPSRQPSSQPTCQPTSLPSQPSSQPTMQPSSQPSCQPSTRPSPAPSTNAPVERKTIYTVPPTIGQKVAFPTMKPTALPSLLPTATPTVAEGTVCVTVSIETSILQDEWTDVNAIKAMKEALSKSTGVKIDSIDVNFADQLCKPAPTASPTREPTRRPPTRVPTRKPTRSPTGNRRILTTESLSISSLVPSYRNSTPSMVYDTKMSEASMIHIAASGVHQLEFSFVIQLTGDDTTVSVDNAITATKTRITTAVFTGSFCNELVTSSKLNNVTNLITPIGIGAIGNVCDTTRIPVFNSLFIAGTKTQPTSMPSDSPSTAPSKVPTPTEPEVMTTSVIGFVAIVVLIFILRFYHFAIDLIYGKPKISSGHRYDILVMIDKDHDAILENINHEDIAFFRRTEIKEKDETLFWIINDTPVVLEKRFEVKFVDKHELLEDNSIKGELASGHKDVKNAHGKLRKNNSLILDKVPMQKGMIIRVKMKDDESSKDNRAYNGEFHSFAETPSPGKRPRPSTHSPGEGYPSNQAISQFVINNSSINEKLKQASLEKYRLKSPRAELSTPLSVGSVSINMTSTDNRDLNRSAIGRARAQNERARAQSECSDSDHSLQSSAITHDHQRSVKFKDRSFRSENKEENEDLHELSSSYDSQESVGDYELGKDEDKFGEDEDTVDVVREAELVREDSLVSQAELSPDTTLSKMASMTKMASLSKMPSMSKMASMAKMPSMSKMASIQSLDLSNHEDKVSPLKKEESDHGWTFPSEEGYKHDDDVWKVNESARLRRGSWRQDDENLDTRLRRGHWRLDDDGN